ncbi:MAG: bifunctional diaminohydroxyphosphoribosylaminopyrimidine deaminase/5-amino-6-(5-phosphoribosylamino)uracil reductase RibD [Vulcanibacillus sp.]
MDEKYYMHLAIELAKKTKGQTSPNPVVGAVVVNNGRIVGLGTHLKAGEAHAEIHALNMAGDFAENSTLYVTLEPCSHYGKTPPCVERIIKDKVKRVVIAMSDPNPLVSGNGVRLLEKAGIEVLVGIYEEEAKLLNEDFCKHIITGLPFITVKTAMTLDGKIASHSGSSKWITGEESRNYVQQLRHESDAIMVGIGTVLADNPQLTVRPKEKGLSPIRVIIDTYLKVPMDVKVITDNESPTIIFTTKNASIEKIRQLEKQNIRVIIVRGDINVSLIDVFRELGDMGITSVLVEGGAILIGSLFDEKLIDKYICFIAPKLVGGALSPSSISGKGIAEMNEAIKLSNISITRYADDICLTGYPEW